MTDRELMQMALDALESSRVFVTSCEKIKHPEGTEWYDERIEALRARLAQPIITDEIKDDKTEPTGEWVGDKEYWEYPKQEVALQSPQDAGYCQQKGEQIKAQRKQKPTYKELYWELRGVIIDVEENGFDEVCLETIKRVADHLVTPEAKPERHLTLTKNEANELVAVTWQDDEHRILEVVREKPEPHTDHPTQQRAQGENNDR